MLVEDLVGTPSTGSMPMNSLTVGSRYKRVKPKTGSYDKTTVLLGIVTDVLASPDGVAITALEFNPAKYGDAPTLASYAGDEDVLIHPASDMEALDLIADAIEEAGRQVREAEAKRHRAIQHYATLKAQLEELAPKPSDESGAVL